MIIRTLERLDTNYPTSQERVALEKYLATFKARRAAHDELRPKVMAIAEAVVAKMRVLYTQFAQRRQHGFEKGVRDIALLTSMASNAMILGEHDTLDEMFTIWYRTILKGVHMSPQFMRDTFQFWLSELQSALSPEAYALLRPHVEHLATYLADLPVPARDETGDRRLLPVS